MDLCRTRQEEATTNKMSDEFNLVDYFEKYDIPRSDVTDGEMLSDDPLMFQVYGYNDRTGMFCIGSGSFIHQSDVTEYAISDEDGIMYIAYEELNVVYKTA